MKFPRQFVAPAQLKTPMIPIFSHGISVKVYLTVKLFDLDNEHATLRAASMRVFHWKPPYLSYWLDWPGTWTYDHQTENFHISMPLPAGCKFQAALVFEVPKSAMAIEPVRVSLLWHRRAISGPPSLGHCINYSTWHKHWSYVLLSELVSQPPWHSVDFWHGIDMDDETLFGGWTALAEVGPWSVVDDETVVGGWAGLAPTQKRQRCLPTLDGTVEVLPTLDGTKDNGDDEAPMEVLPFRGVDAVDETMMVGDGASLILVEWL